MSFSTKCQAMKQIFLWDEEVIYIVKQARDKNATTITININFIRVKAGSRKF